MREGQVECKDCRFWVQYLEEDPNLEPSVVILWAMLTISFS